ncbi:hypothetical protein Bca52824_021749 [Brassica carinata]|uniref:ACT domain-containing protein ACR n=1 Tax=Brassica carinata TaxID=52824 RepID=A0A8X8AS78_BRACI|nr:hypothetical protein Bca52824_021749 [Brassica carinata]
MVPKPMVLIDQDADPEATIVQLSFGDRLGALIDIVSDSHPRQVSFGDRAPGYKALAILDLLELLLYHECSEQLAMGETFGIKAPEHKIDVDIGTHIHVKEDGPKRSLLCIETADRPGLVVEMIKVMADINIDVESAEIDTEGLVAKDKIHVSYQGQALNSSLSQVLVNCLRYFLRRPETDIDSD